MAISPPSDLILDVARAVDPLSYAQAARKLGQSGPADATSGVGFSELFEDMAPPPPEPFVPNDPAAVLTQVRNRDALAGRGASGGPYQDFEAFVLQSFMQSMLPESSAELFGRGTAGEIWRSMLAEQLGAQLAAAGGVGLARQLQAAEHAAGQPLPGVAPGA